VRAAVLGQGANRAENEPQAPGQIGPENGPIVRGKEPESWLDHRDASAWVNCHQVPPLEAEVWVWLDHEVAPRWIVSGHDSTEENPT
jgi:hypothetical protein